MRPIVPCLLVAVSEIQHGLGEPLRFWTKLNPAAIDKRERAATSSCWNGLSMASQTIQLL